MKTITQAGKRITLITCLPDLDHGEHLLGTILSCMDRVKTFSYSAWIGRTSFHEACLSLFVLSAFRASRPVPHSHQARGGNLDRDGPGRQPDNLESPAGFLPDSFTVGRRVQLFDGGQEHREASLSPLLAGLRTYYYARFGKVNNKHENIVRNNEYDKSDSGRKEVP